jgi:hypothetical protein
MQTALVARPGNAPPANAGNPGHEVIENFAQVVLADGT